MLQIGADERDNERERHVGPAGEIGFNETVGFDNVVADRGMRNAQLGRNFLVCFTLHLTQHIYPSPHFRQPVDRHIKQFEAFVVDDGLFRMAVFFFQQIEQIVRQPLVTGNLPEMVVNQVPGYFVEK